MGTASLTPFSYVILVLVGEGGAGPHDLVRMMRQGAWAYWTSSQSQYYAEPKRLEGLGLLSAASAPGRTHDRTVYRLTEAGREALAAWLGTPAAFPRVQNEAAVRLLGASSPIPRPCSRACAACARRSPPATRGSTARRSASPVCRTARRSWASTAASPGGSWRRRRPGWTRSRPSSARLTGRLQRLSGASASIDSSPGAVPLERPWGGRALSHGLLLVPHRLRRPRHGRRPRHRQHPRLRARARHRALRAVGGRDRLAQRRGPRGRDRGQAHARPHARHDLRHPAAEGRRDRRLRRHRGDAAALHPEGAPEPLGAPARRRLRALGRDRRREARGRGGVPERRRPPGLPDRGADGGRDRRRPAGRASRRATWSSTSAAARPRSR